MPFPKKTIVSFALLSGLGLSGCSTIGSLIDSEEGYRGHQDKIVAELEIPPNLFNPSKAKNISNLASLDAERRLLESQVAKTSDSIPAFEVEGVSIQQNLSERWLEVTGDSVFVWNQLQRFFASQGFEIAEARKDIGVLKTQFLNRNEIVPLDDQGPLTRMFNSWRDQYADGIYDQFVARVEAAGEQKVKVYFAHHVMYSDEANLLVGGSESWTLKPSNPVMEAEALYQAMVFFGTTSDMALAQLAATESRIETLDGEEFTGLKVNAGFEETWNYLQTSVYRAGWELGSVNQAKGSIEVKVPNSVRSEESFLSALAFWKPKDKSVLPESLLLKVNSLNAEQTEVVAQAPDGGITLNAEQKRYIFESLGLLNP